jgi:hypothetical protein
MKSQISCFNRKIYFILILFLFQINLFPYKLWNLEENIFKQMAQTWNYPSFNGFIVNSL